MCVTTSRKDIKGKSNKESSAFGEREQDKAKLRWLRIKPFFPSWLWEWLSLTWVRKQISIQDCDCSWCYICYKINRQSDLGKSKDQCSTSSFPATGHENGPPLTEEEKQRGNANPAVNRTVDPNTIPWGNPSNPGDEESGDRNVWDSRYNSRKPRA